MRSLIYTNPLGNSVTLYKDPYLITALDGIEMPTVDEQTQSAPYQDGVTDLDALFEARTIVVSGAIQHQLLADIWTSRAAIMAALSPKFGLGTLTFTDDLGTYTTMCRCISALFPNKGFTQPFQTFQIQFFCPDPYWYADTTDSINMALVSGGFTFPFTFPFKFGDYIGPQSTIAVNAGDSITPVIMTISNACGNPIITNETIGEYMLLAVSLSSGDVLIINTAFGSKSVTKITSGGVVTNESGTIQEGSTFWSLNLGSNSILFDSENGTDQQCTVSWRNRFLGK